MGGGITTLHGEWPVELHYGRYFPVPVRAAGRGGAHCFEQGLAAADIGFVQDPDAVRVALMTLADLTEYHRIGGGAFGWHLSDLLVSGAVSDARVRALARPRMVRLEAWLASKDRTIPSMPRERPPEYTDEQWAQDLADWGRLRDGRVKQARACLVILRGAGFV